MEPRERKQDDEAAEPDERRDDILPEDGPLDPDDDTLGRPVRLER
ncbi:MAG TPA: hypothetical protein VFR53_09440 [Methylomirabilota bacterium]|nr:hypothetical protein [Methylomirabilota bacterium]